MGRVYTVSGWVNVDEKTGKVRTTNESTVVRKHVRTSKSGKKSTVSQHIRDKKNKSW